MSLCIVTRVSCNHPGCTAWFETMVDLANVVVDAQTDATGRVWQSIAIPASAYDHVPDYWWIDYDGRIHYCPGHRSDGETP